MQKIDINYEHEKLVLSVGKQRFYISEKDVLELIDRQKTKERFEDANLGKIYGDFENRYFLAQVVALEQRGLSLTGIADYLGVSADHLKKWFEERPEQVERIKSDPQFKSTVNALQERMPRKGL